MRYLEPTRESLADLSLRRIPSGPNYNFEIAGDQVLNGLANKSHYQGGKKELCALFRGLSATRGKELSLEIVAPDAADMAKRIGDDYLERAKEVKLHKMMFEEYVELLSESLPSFMRQAAAEDSEVQAWLARMYISRMGRRSNHKQNERTFNSRGMGIRVPLFRIPIAVGE